MDEINPDKIVLTVCGDDKIGIVSAVSKHLAKNGINIEDIKQTVMFGNFVMIMTCNLKNLNISYEDFREDIEILSKELNMEIAIQNTGLPKRTVGV